jgi:hypothetical protein
MLSSLKGWGANKRQHIKLAKYLQCDRIHHLRPSAKKSRFQVLVIQEFFIVQGIVNCVLTSWRFSCCLPFKGHIVLLAQRFEKSFSSTMLCNRSQD